MTIYFPIGYGYVSFFNVSLIDIWLHGNGRNKGLTILPWKHFRSHVYFMSQMMGYQNKRFGLGIGLFSFFFDYRCEED